MHPQQWSLSNAAIAVQPQQGSLSNAATATQLQQFHSTVGALAGPKLL